MPNSANERESVAKKRRDSLGVARPRGYQSGYQMGGLFGSPWWLSVSAGKSKEHHDRPAKSDEFFVAEFADAITEFRTWDGGDLVDHEAAGLPESIGVVRLDSEPEQRRFSGVGCEGADRHGIRCIEMIVLHDRYRTWLADVAGARRSGPDLASPQSSSMLTASMNAWSSAACLLAATAAD